MSDLTAVGVHVFAGGFTRGVLDAGWQVPVQLEVHGFGLESTEAMNDIPTHNCAAKDWPPVPALMAFGNPRCTAFSTITSGDRYVNNNTHGAWAKQTCDVHELAHYTAGNYDFVIWESVQQAYKVGKELLDHLTKEHFGPKGYRIAHLFINAASFGNCQQRKRYFYVAYRDCYKFNIQPPVISPYYSVLYDAIYDRQVEGHPSKLWDNAGDYDEDSYTDLTPDEWQVVSKIPCGWDLHAMAKYAYDDLTPKMQFTWDTRNSDMPFSLHGIHRINWLRPCPTLHSSAGRFIHPELHRPLTVGELTKIMGWPRIPVGPRPVAQIAKGIVPAVGKWLADQVELSYRGHWGQDDWESSYDDANGEWVGASVPGKLEKVFDLTKYVGKNFDLERYDAKVIHRHQHNVDRATGRLVRPWQAVAASSIKHGADDPGSDRMVGTVD